MRPLDLIRIIPIGRNLGDTKSARAAIEERVRQLLSDAERIAAMRAFADDVHGGAYPAPQHLVQSEADVVAAFRDWLDREI